MPRFLTALQDEIRRLSRKEVKAQTGVTRRAAAQNRRDIAGLKRHLRQIQQKLAAFEVLERKHAAVQPATADEVERARFSPRWIRARRNRLKLSAAEYGKLIGVSGLTVYNWELAKSKPRREALAALVALKNLGRREALKRLEVLTGSNKKKDAQS